MQHDLIHNTRYLFPYNIFSILYLPYKYYTPGTPSEHTHTITLKHTHTHSLFYFFIRFDQCLNEWDAGDGIPLLVFFVDKYFGESLLVSDNGHRERNLTGFPKKTVE